MYFESLSEAIASKGNPSVLGLDPKLEYVPPFLREGKSVSDALYDFNRGLIDSCADLIPAIKPQSAYYEMHGAEGLDALRRTIEYASRAGMYVILDAKRGDIGTTAEAYAKAYLYAGSDIDCITINPYLGSDGVKPFINECIANDKAVFSLIKTSNKSSAELQDIDIGGGKPFYRHVAELTVQWGADYIGTDGYSVIGGVVGATHPYQLAELRKLMPQTFFLIPGYGAQGGLAQDVALGFDSKGGGAIVNSSRGLMCAYQKQNDPENYKTHTRNAVIAMRDDIMQYVRN